MLGEDEQRLKEAVLLVCEINMGATAIGTGINSHPDYAGLVCRHLRSVTGIPVVTASNLVEATQDCGAFVQLSGVLKRVAVKLSKTCNDLRLLSSGPRVGLNEINLPPMQAGSSIMPGKVNPVVAESVTMIAAQVIGNDSTVTLAGQSGNFQLNIMLPLIAYNLLQSLELLAIGCRNLADNAIAGFSVNRERIQDALARNPILVTALNPIIGYEKGAAIAKKAYREARSIAEVAAEMTDLSPDELRRLLDPKSLTEGGIKGAGS
jgi:aspartate ammonia-lyase